jgi:hypothetical protein
MPPTVNLAFPVACPTFTACGGTLPGLYYYTSACVDNAEFASFVSAVEAQCGAGNVTISNKSGTIKGSASFSTTQVTRAVTGSLSFTASVMGQCATIPMACTLASAALPSYGVTGSCALSGGFCVCNVTRSLTVNTVEAYTSANNQFTLTASARDYDYCTTVLGFIHHEVTVNSGMKIRDPGYYGLTKL